MYILAANIIKLCFSQFSPFPSAINITNLRKGIITYITPNETPSQPAFPLG
jgi:hypothetical protein